MTSPRRKILSVFAGALLAAAHTMAPAQSGVQSGAQTPERNPAQMGSQSSSSSSPHSNTDSSTTSSGSSGSGAAKSSSDITTVTVPMLVIVPVEVQNNPNELNNGCWVRLVDKDAAPQKGNDILTIVGRMNMPSFETPAGINWSHKADSLTVGPKASVTVYSDKNYKGSNAKLTSGQQIKDINKELGFVKSIDSLKVDCTA